MKIRITEEKALFLVVGMQVLSIDRDLTEDEIAIYQVALSKVKDKTLRLVRDIKVEAEYEEKKNNVA